MAIDTATKRASMLGFGSGCLIPVPSGAIEIGDRLTYLTLYSGASIGPVEPPDSAGFEYSLPRIVGHYVLPVTKGRYTLPRPARQATVLE